MMTLSVLLSLYKNDSAYWLNQAIESIYLKQTVKPDQIVLVVDGPVSNEICEVIDRWKASLEDFLVTVYLEQNVGLAVALNQGLTYCSGDLVARMDADDISLPSRFEKQLAFMRNHRDISVCSASIEEIEPDTCVSTGLRLVPSEHDLIVKFIKFRNPVNHPATIFRKQDILDVGGYPYRFRKLQDYALWSLLVRKGYRFANLPDVLLQMRTGDSLLQRRGIEYFMYEVKLINFQRRLGIISWPVVIASTMIRFVGRFSPPFVKAHIYKSMRKKQTL